MFMNVSLRSASLVEEADRNCRADSKLASLAGIAILLTRR
jgi:hypothetical protein